MAESKVADAWRCRVPPSSAAGGASLSLPEPSTDDRRLAMPSAGTLLLTWNGGPSSDLVSVHATAHQQTLRCF